MVIDSWKGPDSVSSMSDYSPRSVDAFLRNVADKIDVIARRATKSPWRRASEAGWMYGPDGGVLATAVHRNNIRMIVAAAPDTVYQAATLFRAAADLNAGVADAVRGAAFDLAFQYNNTMRLKAHELLTPAAASA